MEDSPRLMHVEKVGCARQGQAATRRQSWVRVSQKNSVSSSMLRRGAGTANGHPQSFSATQARTISRHVVRRCREDIDGKIQELLHLVPMLRLKDERVRRRILKDPDIPAFLLPQIRKMQGPQSTLS